MFLSKIQSLYKSNKQCYAKDKQNFNSVAKKTIDIWYIIPYGKGQKNCHCWLGFTFILFASFFP